METYVAEQNFITGGSIPETVYLSSVDKRMNCYVSA